MDCSVCFETFDDEIDERRPYLINPCGHCFCLNCLNGFNPPNCPNCRRKIENKICNWQLIDLIAESKAKRKQEKMNSFNFDLFISFQFDFKDQAKIFNEKINVNKSIKIYKDASEIDKTNQLALTEKTIKIIRHSKVFVCLLTEKYVKSINCIREFEYAHSINKKILLICIDKINLDQLNDIFSFNYHETINCFVDQKNYLNNKNDWFIQKFDSILRSIENKLKVELIFYLIFR
jgi:hypothetical protein